MTTTNIKENCTIIYPPGTSLPKHNIKKPTPVGEIAFENQFKQPLPSLVEAKFNKSKNTITVKALIFVESENNLKSVKVNQLFSISNFGSCKLQFFIYCSINEIEDLGRGKTEGTYKAYTIEFSTKKTSDIPAGITLENIKVVQTFLWNIDPKTSRGTETTVQDTTPD